MSRFRGRVPELHSRGILNHLYGAFLPVPWSIILICLVHSPYLVYLRIFPCVRTHLLARMNFMGKASLDITPPLTSKDPLCTGRVPVFRNEKYVVWAGPSLLPYLSCYSCLGISVHRK